MKKRIYLEAPILSQSGYGVHSRTILEALRSKEDIFEIYVSPLNWGQTGWLSNDDEMRKYIDFLITRTQIYHQQCQQQGKPVEYDIHLQCTIPNEFERKAPISIGITAGVETTKIAPNWIEKCNIMDRIITISEHAKSTLVNTKYQATNKITGEIISDFGIQKPVYVVGYPVKHRYAEILDIKFDYDFNFLLAGQWGVRKNIDNTIKWFVEEFIDQEVGLVCKLSIRNNSLIDREQVEKKIEHLLKDYPERKCKVYLIHGDLNDDEQMWLYRCEKIKAYISLAHGESFGLYGFESAYNGLPIICPNWGGQLDYLIAPVEDKKTGKMKNKSLFAKVDYDLKPIQDQAVWDGVLVRESMWCYPKQGSFKMKLREVYKNYDRFKKQAEILREYLQNTFTEEEINKQMVEAILGGPIKETKKTPKEELSNVSIITSVFNGAEYMESFFKDITRQTLFDKCELILIHPKTSPTFNEEEEEIKKWINKYPNNIVYEQIEEDKGVYSCWNKAIKMSKYDLITNWNLDDRRKLDAIENQVREIENDDDIDLVYADSLLTHVPNETWENNTSNGNLYRTEEHSIESMLRGNCPHAAPLWKKELHNKNGYFDEEMTSASDWKMWLECTFNGAKFKKISEPLSLYLFSQKGLSTSKENNKRKIKEEMSIFKEFQRRYMQLNKGE